MSVWHSGTPTEYRNQIVTGDSRELAKRLPDQSVDLVLCDPVWWYVHDYAWLAWVSERVLRPGGSVIAQVGSDWRYAAETAFRSGNLTPRPLIAEPFAGGHYQHWKHRCIAAWHPYLWFTKGERTMDTWVRDLVAGGGRDKSVHRWGDTPTVYIHAIERLTKPGSIVLDPFTGGGTVPAACKLLGRNYIAFEIDPDTASSARERVLNTPVPLLVADEGLHHPALALEAL